MLTIDTASRTFHCKTWVTGQTQGKAVIARERISFWGGFDPQTGRIVDPTPPCADATSPIAS